MHLGLYQHYKGNFYRVMAVGRLEETLEEVVIYHAMQGNYEVWVRPIKVFNETIEIEGKEIPRFKFIKPLFSEAEVLIS
ncbi:MAG: DUF1653 domain-containing protein [Sphingobacteriia bacterium]|nr:DUF1653 domain-containing protein [Sphingobacteriia bacterium]